MLTRATVAFVQYDTEVHVVGTDADGDAAGVAIAFEDAAGALLDLSGDGRATLDEDSITLAFDAPATTPAFDVSLLRRENGETTLARSLITLFDPRTAIVRVFDRSSALSAPIEVPVTRPTFRGLDPANPALCDENLRCHQGLECSAGACSARNAATIVCSAARPITLPAPSSPTVASTARVRGANARGLGTFDASCSPGAGTIGPEAIYSLTVPAPASASVVGYDVLLTTESTYTDATNTDTVLSVRRDCVDRGSELGCNDDVMEVSNVRSALELRAVAAGTYTVLVEQYFGDLAAGFSHELSATLRPILVDGTSCDGTSAANRCQNRCVAGACAP